MLVTLGVYAYFTKVCSSKRRVQIRDRKNADQKSEFYLNESIMNYETVKQFNNEKLETSRYHGLLDNLRRCALAVQYSLSELNIGQAVIYTTGLTLNLMMAASGVHSGTMTPGDFILLQAYFL